MSSIKQRMFCENIQIYCPFFDHVVGICLSVFYSVKRSNIGFIPFDVKHLIIRFLKKAIFNTSEQSSAINHSSSWGPRFRLGRPTSLLVIKCTFAHEC
jgi:hypothetical protein